MGYQVGINCYADKQQAENHYFSMMPPAIVADGTIRKPEWTKSGWQYQGQPLKADLPQCDPLENLKDGQLIGWLVFGVLLVGFWAKVIKERLKL